MQIQGNGCRVARRDYYEFRCSGRCLAVQRARDNALARHWFLPAAALLAAMSWYLLERLIAQPIDPPLLNALAIFAACSCATWCLMAAAIGCWGWVSFWLESGPRVESRSRLEDYS